MNDPSGLKATGSCFGFTVRSSLSFEFLRSGPGIALDVEESDADPLSPGELLREWQGQAGEKTFRTRLYSGADRDYFWLERFGWFGMEANGPRITMPSFGKAAANLAWRESVMWGTPAAVCAIRQGLTSMHAASVDVDGAALLLTAPGTYGKTTLAAGFHKAGYRLLSDDMVCCRLSPKPEVLPGPAVLRLRRDVYENLEFAGVKQTHQFGGKFGLVLDDARRGSAQPVPLAGIVLLRRSTGPTAVTRAQPHDAVRDLFALSLNGVFDHGRSFQDLAELVSRVPVWNLERKLEYGGLDKVVEALVRACLKG